MSDVAPTCLSFAYIDVDESLLRVDADPSVAECFHPICETIHSCDGKALDHDVSGASEQVPALFRAANGQVVVIAAVAAGDVNGRVRKATELLERIHQAGIDIDSAATPADELAL